MHEKEFQKRREERRGRIYRDEWPKVSRAMRHAEPWCHALLDDGSMCRATDDLTLDHEHRQVECRACNAKHKGTTQPGRRRPPIDDYDIEVDPAAYYRETR